MPETKQHTIRLPAELFDRIAMQALSMRKSINKQIETMLQKALDAQREADQEAANAPGKAN